MTSEYTEKSMENGTNPTTSSPTTPPSEHSQFPFSKSITHLKSFPVVSDSISVIQAHPIGQRSISISTTAYDKFVKPFSPYIVKANDLASPYVAKADDIADHGIGKVEEKFPILKEPTENLTGKVTETVLPMKQYAIGLYGHGLELANQRKEYVANLYHEELTKDGGKGYLPAAKAGLTTTLVIAADGLQWVVDHLGRRVPLAQNTDEKTEPMNGNSNGTINEKSTVAPTA